MPICGQGVEHRYGNGLEGLGELVQIAGLAHGPVLVEEGGGPRLVGIAQRQHAAVGQRPRVKQAIELLEVDDRAEVGAVEGVGALLQHAVLAFHLDGDVFGGDVAPLALVAVLQQVVWVELEFVEREPGGEGGGVGPGQVGVEADAYPRQALQGGAGHVVLPRQGQMHLVEAAVTGPGAMRVGQQQPLAALAEVAAHGQGVAAVTGTAEGAGQPAQALGQLSLVGFLEGAGGAGAWPGGVEDRPAHDALVGTALQWNPSEQHPQVRGVDFKHPVGIPAAGIALGQVGHPGLAQVAVHAEGKSLHHAVGCAVRIGQEVGFEGFPVTEQKAQHQVGDRIAPRFAEKLRGAAGGGDDAAHGRAEVVLGVGVPVAVAEAPPVLGLDVGDAVLGTADGGLVRGLRLRGGNRGP